MSDLRASGLAASCRAVLLAILVGGLWLAAAVAQTDRGDEPGPLAPPDISSPRAALATFIDSVKATIDRGREGDRAGMRAQAHRGFTAMDMEMEPGDAGLIQGMENAALLFDVLAHIDLPPPADIPDAAAVADEGLREWTIPQTEIRLAAVEDADGAIEGFRFTNDTIKRAREFLERVENLSTKPDFLFYAGAYNRFRAGPGAEAPAAFAALVHSLPPPWFAMVAGMAVWKWAALLTISILSIAAYVLCHGFALVWRQRSQWSHAHNRWSGLALTVLVLGLTFATYFVAVEWIRVVDRPRAIVVGFLIVLGHLAFVLLIFQVLERLANVVIRVRELGVGSLDTQLVRLLFRLLSVLLSLYVLVHLVDSLGVPVAPMLAGLGVGGLAVALAVRPTLENVVAAFVLFADKPVRVGEFCQFGDKLGTVEAVGLRSVRIRGVDRTVISVPNAEFCQLQLVNFSRRDQILLRSRIGLRYDTTADQLRLILVRLRELLIRHPKVSLVPARVRFVEYSASSLDLEIFAHVQTRDFGEFLAIQEDLLLRIKDIVEAAGAGFAFPSQSLYIERAGAVDVERTAAAEQTVQRWREEKRLPFPDHEEQFRYELSNTLDYPPEGSPGATSKSMGSA